MQINLVQKLFHLTDLRIDLTYRVFRTNVNLNFEDKMEKCIVVGGLKKFNLFKK